MTLPLLIQKTKYSRMLWSNVFIFHRTIYQEKTNGSKNNEDYARKRIQVIAWQKNTTHICHEAQSENEIVHLFFKSIYGLIFHTYSKAHTHTHQIKQNKAAGIEK